MQRSTAIILTFELAVYIYSFIEIFIEYLSGCIEALFFVLKLVRWSIHNWSIDRSIKILIKWLTQTKRLIQINDQCKLQLKSIDRSSQINRFNSDQIYQHKSIDKSRDYSYWSYSAWALWYYLLREPWKVEKHYSYHIWFSMFVLNLGIIIDL